jgi:lipopolysaccharide export LptBFGC system permease protein LptF
MQRSEQAIDRKHIIGILIIVTYAVIIFIVPLIADKHLAPILATITLVMVAVLIIAAYLVLITR